MSEEGIRDKRGIIVCPGDLIKTLHFIGARRKKYFLYHVITKKGEHLWANSIASLLNGNSDGSCRLSVFAHEDFEIIDSYRVDENYLDYSERRKAGK